MVTMCLDKNMVIMTVCVVESMVMVTVQNEKSFSVRSDKYHRGGQETVTLSYTHRGNQLKKCRTVLNVKHIVKWKGAGSKHMLSFSQTSLVAKFQILNMTLI